MRKFSRGMAAVLASALLVMAGCGGQSGSKSSGPVTLDFYYPVVVGGPIAQAVEKMVGEFNDANPDIKVNPVFAGAYDQTLTKVQTAWKAGGEDAPEVAVLLSTDLFTLTDMQAIVELDQYIKKDKDGEEYIKDFLPAFMLNSQTAGKTYGIPFQRSTPVLYYNKDLFKAAGLDPEKPPQTWDELVTYGKKLTKADGSQWGLELPSDGFPHWIFSSFFIQNSGKNVVNDLGNEVSFNSPEVIEALEFIQSLSSVHKISPPGITKWGDVPNDFVNGQAAMVYHTTGSIANIRSKMDNSKIGMAFMPAGKAGFGAPTGGGNFYILKTDAAKQEAAWKFVRFMTEPERMAQWGVDSGYVAVRESSWETQIMKDAVAAFPGYKVAKDQLQHADREIAAHQGPEITKVLGDALQAVVNGTKTPKVAMDEAQAAAEKILAPFKK